MLEVPPRRNMSVRVKCYSRAAMGEFAIGQGVPRFEDPRLLRGGGKYVDDIVLPGMAFGHVLRSPHAHAKIKSIDTSKAKAAPGVLCVLTGDDWIKSGWGDLPVPGTHKRRDGSTNYKPRYPGAGEGPRALRRRLRRLRRGRDQEPGDGRRRTDRGRLRAAAGHDRHRRRRQARRDAGLGRLQGQHLLHRDPRRQGQDRGGLRQRRACGESSISSSTASPPRRWSRAARSATTTRSKTSTRSTPPCSARIPIAPSSPSSC